MLRDILSICLSVCPSFLLSFFLSACFACRLVVSSALHFPSPSLGRSMDRHAGQFFSDYSIIASLNQQILSNLDFLLRRTIFFSSPFYTGDFSPSHSIGNGSSPDLIFSLRCFSSVSNNLCVKK